MDDAPEPESERSARSERVREQLRRNELPEEWRAELGDVDGDTVLLMFWLDVLGRRVHSAHREEIRRVGLSVSEAKLVYHLLLSGPPYRESPTQINTNLDMTSGGVTKTVDRLESRGFVARKPDAADGRSVLVELTPRGCDAAKQVAKAFAQRYEQLVGSINERERHRAVRSVRKLLDAIDGPL